MDNMLLLACSKTLFEVNEKVQDMMVRQQDGLEWSCTHWCDFVLDKFGIMGFMRRRESNPVRKPSTRPI